MSLRSGFGRPPELTFAQKLREVNWGLVLLVTAVASVGFAMLYSAAGGSFAAPLPCRLTVLLLGKPQ